MIQTTILFKYLAKKIKGWAKEDTDDENYAEKVSAPVNYSIGNSRKVRSANQGSNSSSLNDYNYGMNFTVFNAIGGKVVQLQRYDEKNDKNHVDLYIVVDNEDFGEQLAMIITRNNLSR